MNIPYNLAVRMITGIEDQKQAEKEFERFFKWAYLKEAKCRAKSAREKLASKP